MKQNLILCFIVIIFSSCKTNNLYFNIAIPSQVTISGSVKRVGIVNRTIPPEENKGFNTALKIFSAQSDAMVKEGSDECMRGLKDALIPANRFESVQILDSEKMNTNAMGLLQSPLSWEQVSAICSRNNIEALVVLEVFDTELKIGTPAPPPDITDPTQVINAAKQAKMTTLVKTGWRIYDPASHLILDQFSMMKDFTIYVNGNPVATVDAMVNRKESIKKTANDIGHIYALRILPEWLRVRREYYIKGGSENFKTAKRKARTGNWEGAAELWKKETTNTKRKSAGRACYNMAIINEMNGNIDEAISWAQKAYEDYNIRTAIPYITILKRRIQDNHLLNKQQPQ